MQDPKTHETRRRGRTRSRRRHAQLRAKGGQPTGPAGNAAHNVFFQTKAAAPCSTNACVGSTWTFRGRVSKNAALSGDYIGKSLPDVFYKRELSQECRGTFKGNSFTTRRIIATEGDKPGAPKGAISLHLCYTSILAPHVRLSLARVNTPCTGLDCFQG